MVIILYFRVKYVYNSCKTLSFDNLFYIQIETADVINCKDVIVLVLIRWRLNH